MIERAVGGIQSLDAALSVLRTLAASGSAMTLTDLAKASGMPATKVHRYLASFVASGFVEQRERSGRYDLGPAALSIGLSAMARNDVVNRVADALPDLVEETGLTALLSIWGDHGPTVVRWERAAAFFITSLGLGTTTPLINSATGRVFLTYLPRLVTQGILQREVLQSTTSPDRSASASPVIAKPGVAPSDNGDPDALAHRTRSNGYASVDGRFIPGLAAIAAPVLDWQMEATCAVTLIGTDTGIIGPKTHAVQALKTFCAAFSTNSITNT